ncbi:MAG: hypothetical protein PHY09_00840 [Desulfuromonadaceae bacterium]|nr:hypothetical protein [Desulfuromonadaceae bacterium]MDD5104861.1 hypothetical protein [Desulfuromonadaceae bacterium]
MGDLHQLREAESRSPQLDTLAELITKAQECHGHFYPDEVLALAVAAKAAVESLLSDMEQASKDALQEAIYETFLTKGNA